MSTAMGLRLQAWVSVGLRMVALGMVCSIACGAAARAQSSQAFELRVEALRGQIGSAEARHAGAAEMGGLWLQLANRNQDELEFARAEDGFARALRLLRGPETQAAYADALDGMGSLDLSMARASEAREYFKRALAIYESLGDGARTAALHERLGLELLFEARYREAEAESAEGLRMLLSQPQLDAENAVAAYLTHSYALCHMGRCGEGLEDARRASALVQEKLPDDGLDRMVVSLLRGYAEWKTGQVDDGEQAVREALRIARELTTLPQPLRTAAEVSVMRQYAALLKESKRKAEAKQMEAQISQLRTEQPGGCAGCTVSVGVLGLR